MRQTRSGRHRAGLALLLLVTALLAAPGLLGGCGQREEPPGPPLLWVLDGPARVYLFGTVHLPDPRVRELAPSVHSAHAASDVVLGELGVDDLDSVKATIKQFMPHPKRLGDVVPPEVLARLRAYMQARGGSAAGLERLKPVWAAVTLGMLDHLELLARYPPMDRQLLVDAKQAGKQHGGLETLDEQLGLFNGLSWPAQAKFLDRTLADLEKARDQGLNPIDGLLDAYRRGDLDALHAEMTRMTEGEDADMQAFGKALLDDRNVVMAERLLARLGADPGKVWFVAVGAGHLPGPQGLIALLSAQGFTARRAARDERFPAPVREPAAVR